ncbi:hypothetical protein PF008_g25902, partial [Phytophthora fragariae]
ATVIAYVEKRGADFVLTALVSLVSSTSPNSLKWKRIDAFSQNGRRFGSCFETFDSRYAINLFMGIVLTDGNAPGGLPSDIRGHERFQSLFGHCNFEVISVDGLFQTESMYCERLYKFQQQEDGDLFVQELDHFPARLRELYSHWYWVERKCVLFRPKQAKCREVFFVAPLDDSGAL